jgi:hypothetical protein
LAIQPRSLDGGRRPQTRVDTEHAPGLPTPFRRTLAAEAG